MVDEVFVFSCAFEFVGTLVSDCSLIGEFTLCAVECASTSSSGVRVALQATPWKAPSPASGCADLERFVAGANCGSRVHIHGVDLSVLMRGKVALV